MKNLIFALALFLSATAFVSCSETETKETTIIKEVEVKDDNKGALERAAEKVDNEANKEIDKEIEKIGDN